jgi:osmotically-inducible protein OsmY
MQHSILSPSARVDDFDADEELCQRIRLFLDDVRRPGLSQLKVQSSGGVVTLQGKVTTFFVRQLAIGCARRVAGVRKVIDQIAVTCPLSHRDSSQASGEPWSAK